MTQPGSATRTNQRLRTRAAIVGAARTLATAGTEVTMPTVAVAALVSEATAYRYFPDLHSLLLEALWGDWPDAADAAATVSAGSKTIDRVACATEALLRRTVEIEAAARAFIAATIARRDRTHTLPSFRADLIDLALAPLAEGPRKDAIDLDDLRRQLCAVASPELLFTLMDTSGMSADDAVTTAVHMARSLTKAATTRR